MKISALAILGFGRIAEVLYAPHLPNYSSGTVYICEPNSERYNRIKDFFPFAKIIDNVNMLPSCQDSSSIAFNLLPGPDHQALNTELIHKGWNIFTEKPAAVSKHEWTKIVELANRLGRVIVSAPVTCYMPEVDKIILDLYNNVIGDISEVHAQFFGGGPARKGFVDESRKWFFEKDSCVIRDLGPYLVSTTVRIFNPFDEFIWYRNMVRPEINVRPRGIVIPYYGIAACGLGKIGNTVINLSIAYRSYMKKVESRIKIVGTKGEIELELDEQKENTSKQKVDVTFDLIFKCMNNNNFWREHTNQVGETLNIINCLSVKTLYP